MSAGLQPTARSAAVPRVSAEAVRRATGRSRHDWFALLDSWGATKHSHRDIAAWLRSEHGVESWWSQTLTVDYEQARGLRPPGGHRDGTYAVTASRTVAVPVHRLFEAFTNPRIRSRWLSRARMRLRTALPGRAVRFDWGDGTTRLVVGFAAKGKAATQVAVQHERLPDAKTAAETKAYWRERLDVLKALLEGSPS